MLGRFSGNDMGIDLNKQFGHRECPSCATEVPANNNRCPICGYEFPVTPPHWKATVWVVAVILLVIIFGSWVFRIW